MYKGLSSEEVKRRIEKGQVNEDSSVKTKSYGRIICDNLFTLFNLLNLIFGILIFAVGYYRNLTFISIAVINTLISTIQEIRSKKVLDRLQFESESKAQVIRDGEEKEISKNEIVLNDVIKYKIGNQVIVDSRILEGEVEVNESFITGESETVHKKVGDILLSGSFIVSGVVICEVKNVGKDNYIEKISKGAKYFKKANSEIKTSLDKIIQFMSIAIIPIGIIFFINQFGIQGNPIRMAVVNTVAAVIGMIPEGLVLLVSSVLAVATVRLAKKKVLVQQSYCIENLARVDTICFDKTGTLTEGSMKVEKIISINNNDEKNKNILANILLNLETENITSLAIKKFAGKVDKEFKITKKIDFSSEKKISGIECGDKKYLIGAPEFVLKGYREELDKIKKLIIEYEEDYRVIILSTFKGKNVETNCIILLSDVIRGEAKKTIQYFKEQGVNVKIISGDNPVTVSKIAKRCGVENYDKYIDMSEVKDKDIKKVINEYTVFGRVSPMQKKELIIALKKAGHTVAMTGDGVNDVLALKEADCSIAMSNGADAAKNVSEVVLLDSNFASIPSIVLEGRRTINNIERSASLFLVKTIYSSIMSVLFLFIRSPYPFIPVHVSLISFVTIGVPSFMLALEPNNEIVRKGFLRNVIRNAFPTAISVIFMIVGLAYSYNWFKLDPTVYSTLCICSTGWIGILFLFKLSLRRKNEKIKINKNIKVELPFSPYRIFWAILMLVVFWFALDHLQWWFVTSNLMEIIKPITITLVIGTIAFISINLLAYYFNNHNLNRVFKNDIFKNDMFKKF